MVANGGAYAVVTGTGMATEIGIINAGVQEASVSAGVFEWRYYTSKTRSDTSINMLSDTPFNSPFGISYNTPSYPPLSPLLPLLPPPTPSHLTPPPHPP